MKEQIKIPFDCDGNLLHYASRQMVQDWGKENFEFTATLTFAGFKRGRSAAYAIFKDEKTGKQYSMFLTDLARTLDHKYINCGDVYGVWTFQKRGTNYGIRLVR